MAVPMEMLTESEQGLVKEMAVGAHGSAEAYAQVWDELPVDTYWDEVDYTLAAAERLVILARKAVELRDQRREDEARAEWGSKDSDPRVP